MKDLKQIAEQLAALKPQEATEMLQILEEDYNIKPATTQVIGQTEEKMVDDTPKLFNVLLKAAGGKKLQVVKLVKEVLGLGLKDSKILVDSAPVELGKNLSESDAEVLKSQFVEMEAEVEILSIK